MILFLFCFLQVRAQLAEKAQQAYRAAEAALAGKLAMVEQLEHEMKEAQAVVQEEASSCQQTQYNLRAALGAAAQAGFLVSFFFLTCFAFA